MAREAFVVGPHSPLRAEERELVLAVLEALIEVGFSGQAAVELSRDSHRAPQAAEDAMRALRTALDRLEDRKRVSRS